MPDPTPTPAAAPAPATPTPSPTPSSDGVPPSFDATFNDIEDAPAAPAPEPAKATPSPAPTPAEPAAPAKAPEPAKPADAPKVEDHDDDVAPAAGTPAQLRKWGQRQQEKLKATKSEVAQMRQELEALKQGGASNKSPDVQALTAQLADYQKKVEANEQALRMTRYEQSQEYQDKFKKPYEQSIGKAYRTVKQLEVTTTDKESGDTATRAATEADFNELYDMPLGKATRIATEMFGPAAPLVMQHWQQAHDLAEQAYNSIQEMRTKGSEIEQQQRANQARSMQERHGLWTKLNADLNKNKWVGEREDDPEWNAELAKGRQIVDIAFDGRRANLKPQEQVMLDAQVRNRAAAFVPLKNTVSRLESKMAEMQKTIDELRSSGPGAPRRTSDTAPATPETWETALDKLPE